jgi:hypothetical protein
VTWSLPYSRRRRYLTGADWLVGMLDYMTRQACGVGNASQVVLEIDGCVPEQTLRDSLTTFLSRLPFLRGAPARDLNLAPYWRPLPPGHGDSLPFAALHLAEDAAATTVMQTLASGLDRPLGSATQRLSFLWVTLGERRSYLAMAFDHWLLDARGAEMLLSLFLEHLDGRPIEDRLSALGAPESAHLDRWLDRHYAGQRVIAHLRWLAEGTTAVLARPRTLDGRLTHFAFVHFEPDDTERIVDTAYREAGYLMLQSFLLAAVVQAVHPLFCARQAGGAPATDYVVPVSVDMRPPRGAEALVLFNHLSFVLFRVPVALAEERSLLAARICEQVVGQVKAGLPQDIADASDLLRILPLPLLSRVARIPMRGELGSFSFAQLASARPHEPAVWRGRLSNLFHMPRVPVPPGFALVANQFGGRLNLVLSAHEAVVSKAELSQIADTLRQLPLSCAAPDRSALATTRAGTPSAGAPRPA